MAFGKGHFPHQDSLSCLSLGSHGVAPASADPLPPPQLQGVQDKGMAGQPLGSAYWHPQSRSSSCSALTAHGCRREMFPFLVSLVQFWSGWVWGVPRGVDAHHQRGRTEKRKWSSPAKPSSLFTPVSSILSHQCLHSQERCHLCPGCGVFALSHRSLLKRGSW